MISKINVTYLVYRTFPVYLNSVILHENHYPEVMGNGIPTHIGGQRSQENVKSKRKVYILMRGWVGVHSLQPSKITWAKDRDGFRTVINFDTFFDPLPRGIHEGSR